MPADPPPQTTTEYPCPQCGHSVPAATRLLIDTVRNPQLGAEARRGQLGQITCPSCGRRFATPLEALVWDPDLGFAVALVPLALGAAEPAVDRLLAAWLTTYPGLDIDSRILEPEVVGTPEALGRALDAAALADAEDGPELDLLLSFAVQRQAEPVLELIDLLAGVGDEAAFLEMVNQHPALLTGERYRAVLHLADEAEAEALDTVADILRDLAALLRIHLPETEDEDELEDDEDLSDAERELRDAGAAATDSTDEGTDPRGPDDAQRALQTVERSEAEWREGFIEHARLFGTLVDDMLEPDSPDELPDSDDTPLPGAPEGVTSGDWRALLTAATPDLADDVLAARPQLVSKPVAEGLRHAIRAAAAQGLDGLVAHLDMLLQAAIIAGAESDDESEDDE